MHEEDFVGNYDYGFYWYFYLDGRIELECKATGIVFTSGRPEGEYEYATEMAPRLGAPFYQHLFSARLDVAIDGNKCHVDELEAKRLPISPENPHGNAFIRTATRLKNASDAQRVAAMDKGRVWRIASSEAKNRLGRSTGYALFPEGQPVLLAPATCPINTQGNRSVDGEDIVLWHTFGLTHFPRAEDWPMMPVDYAGFKMIPEGSFDRNPTLDVPECPVPGNVGVVPGAGGPAFVTRDLGEGQRAATAGGWFPLTPQAPTHFAQETGEAMV
ncbi:copper amine oxidase, putative [Phytophthora infestans T30-4]|uniref:Amine oxidase n=1 Tax=Phytophthora infestans (strain T30-4) TaxID=403677 RepID=D0MYD0_PHYIT|nr:copper amine oxidase, putative [Phytophthora infestans T30-4]EEY66178.1 copper amine oxidase, putative [Phytophthora infestans T30-4]|eukprot:XP_002906777.1 copper amine oxidase, putative [Phytophthora infestans T30-4]